MSNILPVTHLHNRIPQLYTPVECKEDVPRSMHVQLRSCLSSRAFWRAALSALFLLLLLELYRAAPTFHGLLASGTQRAQDDVDWSQYAYCQYTTNEAYLCNSLMIFESLSQTESKASKVLLYPQEWDPNSEDSIGHNLRKMRDNFNVQLSPIEVQHFSGETTWAKSFTKLLAFNQTQFKRVISLDSDATVLQSMDELFILPPAPVAMGRAYWLEATLSSTLMVIEPSDFEFQRIQDAFRQRQHDEFDMEIVNNLYGNDCIVTPHRRYDLLTGEFRAKNHTRYLGSEEEIWDPEAVLNQAKLVHFSDWPLPKPWLAHTEEEQEKVQPDCYETDDGEDCRDREIWLGLYQDFRDRREVCTARSNAVDTMMLTRISARLRLRTDQYFEGRMDTCQYYSRQLKIILRAQAVKSTSSTRPTLHRQTPRSFYSASALHHTHRCRALSAR